MQRVSLTWVVEQLKAIDSLEGLKSNEKGISSLIPLFQAKESLTQLMAGSVYSQHLRVSKEKADTLFETLHLHTSNENAADDFFLSELEVWNVKTKMEQFVAVFLSELATLPVYLITSKGPFDIERLVDSGSELFPSDMIKKAPETAVDSMEAGKCLAFERSTACGFHTFRVLESVLRRYWDIVANCNRPEPQTLGKMAADLENKGVGDTKVTEALKQLTKLHRNPISHPDVVLSQEEARAIIGMAHSVITHMLNVLPEVPPTTSLPAASSGAA